MLNIFPQTLCSGDIYPLSLSFTNPDGTPKDLSGKTLGLTVKKVPMDSDDTLAPFMQNVFGDTTGKANFIITELAAGNYWMDIKIWTTGQSPSDRQTLIAPMQMNVTQSVTTRST